MKKESLANKRNIKTENKVKGIPFLTTIDLTFISMKNAIIPKTKSIFAILLPIIFPKAMSEVPFIDENILILNSGRDVANARTVKPIIRGLTLRAFPKEDEPSTR